MTYEDFTELDKMIIFLELLPETYRERDIMKKIIKLLRDLKEKEGDDSENI